MKEIVMSNALKGEVVTLVSMMGEVVARLKQVNDDTYVLEHPRLFVPSQEGSNGGFAPGISMTGVQDPEEVEVNKAVILTVVKSHESIRDAWIEVTSGIILP
jgi:hypothetical protein